MDRVEEPQRRVGRVVQPLLRAFREHVRNQAVAHVMAERAQDVSRLALTAGAECQPFEADHRVAAPVGEPVIAGDDRAHLVAGRAGARRLLDSAGRRDDELIGRQHQLRGHAGRRRPLRRWRSAACAAAARRSAAPPGSSAPIVSHDSVDADQRPGAPGSSVRAEVARASTDRRSTRSRDSARAAYTHVVEAFRHRRERLVVAVQEQPQRRHVARRRRFRTDRRAPVARTARRPDG